MKRILSIFAVCSLVLLPVLAMAQVGLPAENHYKVYRVQPGALPPVVIRPVTLIDQFGIVNVNYLRLEKFANPAEKRHDNQVWPILDPIVHQTWWRIDVPQPVRTVIAIDQFGYGPITLGNAVYLLNPALKNVLPPYTLPVHNHYLCYEVIGSLPIFKPVILIDQFGTCNVVVVQSKLFCNPVEKREFKADGTVISYPIIDYIAHLNCYLVDNPIPNFHPVTAIDQFGTWQIDVYQNDCLCVPALKEHILKSQSSTWGGIKALYR